MNVSRTRPKFDVFGTTKTDQVLATLMGGTSGDSQETPSAKDSHDEVRKGLEAKVQELTAELAQQQGIARIPFTQITRNPLNPRVIFPPLELQTFAEVLKEQGQLEPGVVIEMTDDIRGQLQDYAELGLFELKQPLFDIALPYLLFNGERRWRSGPLAGFTEFMAVVLPSTIAKDLLDMQAKAAATSIFQKKLHPLEMGQFLITQINYLYPHLLKEQTEEPSVVYPRVLNSFIVRLQRDDKRTEQKHLTEVNQLAMESRERQLHWLNGIENDLERAVLDVLFRYQQKPSTTNRHIFPLLRLPDDLKRAIYEAGLEVEKIDELKKLNSKSLGLPETKVIALRSEVAKAAIDQNWDKQTIAQRVAEVLTQHQSEDEIASNVKLPPTLSKLEKVDFAELGIDQLQLCEQMLTRRLQEVRERLQSFSGAALE